MNIPANEFSDLDRAVLGPDGTTYELVADVAYGVVGWGILWRKGDRSRDPIVYAFVGDEQIHQELTGGRQDAERIIGRLEQQIRSGTFSRD